MTGDSSGGAGGTPEVALLLEKADGTGPRSPEPSDQGDPWPADPDGSSTNSGPRDWAWVEEWRANGEPAPLGPGMAVAAFVLLLVASAVYVLSAGLADRVVLDIGVNILVAGGLGPALWLSRDLPVLRWIAAGAVCGVVAGWVSVLIFRV